MLLDKAVQLYDKMYLRNLPATLPLSGGARGAVVEACLLVVHRTAFNRTGVWPQLNPRNANLSFGREIEG